MIRYAKMLMIMASLTVATAVDSAQGQCTTTFNGATGDPWQDPDNWDFGRPDDQDVACIDGNVDEVVVLWEACLGGSNEGLFCTQASDCPGSSRQNLGRT